MKRRVLCVLLSALMLLSLLPSVVQPVYAYQDLTTGDACVDILKAMEGFLKYPTYDHGQYSIGYGCGCDPADYPNGITEEEAEALLRQYLTQFEKTVNGFAKRYNLTFKQHQFDALVLFTYNVGGNWVNSDGEFRQAVISGAKGNDFIYPFCLWSTASGKLNINLVKRRLIEADMYLNGSYENKVPASYTYVTFDNNGGISDVKVQGYDSNLTAQVKPIPTLSGSRFLGWYTQQEGGSWVTGLGAAQSCMTLYAHWQVGDGDVNNGTAASYQINTNRLGAQSAYDLPSGNVVGPLEAGTTVKIVADYVDAANVKWGKCEDGTWVNLGNPLAGVVSTQVSGVEVTVTGDAVNVRSGPGTTYGIVGGVARGDKLTITETRTVGNDVWGQFNLGWICLRYTTYTPPAQDDDTDAEPDMDAVAATGIVVNCDALRIRSGPGVSYSTVGSVPAGTRVNIIQIKNVGGVPWGKISSGWICLTYVKLDEGDDDTTGGNPDTDTDPDTDPDTTPDPDPAPSTGEPGTVCSQTGLNVRSGPGTTYAIVGAYRPGDRVTILEQRTVNTGVWGKTDKGWISMAYVKLDSEVDDDTDTNPDTDPDTTEDPVTGTVKAQSGLNIRSGPGTNYSSLGRYSPGDKVTILERRTINGVTWGRTDIGWISLAYVKLDPEVSDPDPDPDPDPTPDTTPDPADAVTGKVTAQTGLNIRCGPGTTYAAVGVYQPGEAVTILEQKVVNGVTWGKTDRGWISMAYVKLDSTTDTTPEPNPDPDPDTQTPPTGETNATVTSTIGLNIRKEPSSKSAQLGVYPKGTRILILKQTTVEGVAWGQTDLGWVCLTYVKMDTTNGVDFEALITATSLAIRDKAGMDSNVVGFYVKGTKVLVTETVKVGNQEWGLTQHGWICLSYVKKL